jgi:hypothetical protein
MTVLGVRGEDGGVIEDSVVFVVRRGLIEAILTGQMSDQSKLDGNLVKTRIGKLALHSKLNESQDKRDG